MLLQLHKRLAAFSRNELRALKSMLDSEQKRRIRQYMSIPLENTDIYQIITGHSNTEQSLLFIRNCAPIVFPIMQINKWEISVETWKKKTLALVYDEDNYDRIVRLFISPLEALFRCASYQEKRGIIAYLSDETQKLINFNPEEWIEYSNETCSN